MFPSLCSVKAQASGHVYGS